MAAGIKASADGLYGTLQVNSADVVTFNSSGNVGIGTNTPVQLLTLESTENIRSTIRNSTENTSYSSSLDFATGAGSLSSSNVVGRVVGLITQADPSTLQSALAFHTNGGDSVVERMRIDSSGNVGIGTSSPTNRLQLSSTGNPGLVFDGTNQGTDLKRIRLVTQIAAAGDFAIQSMNDAGSVKSTNLYIDASANLKFNSGYGSAATAYGCRAWVNFNGTGTVAIRASGNVSSITDSGTGRYEINLTTAMPDANYSISGACGRSGTDDNLSVGATVTSTSAFHVETWTTANVVIDVDNVMFAIFR